MSKAGTSSCKLSLMVKAATVVTNWKSHKEKSYSYKADSSHSHPRHYLFVAWPSSSLLWDVIKIHHKTKSFSSPTPLTLRPIEPSSASWWYYFHTLTRPTHPVPWYQIWNPLLLKTLLCVSLSLSLVTWVPVKIEYQLKSIKSPALHRWTSNPTQGFYEAIKGKWNFMQWNLTEIVITIV